MTIEDNDPVHTTTLPETLREYETRFKNAYTVSGAGLDTMVHAPCPFCACPNWVVYKLLEVAEVLARGGECLDCGRSARMVYFKAPTLDPYHVAGPSARTMELVQTGGDDPPTWLPNTFRRATDNEDELEV